MQNTTTQGNKKQEDSFEMLLKESFEREDRIQEGEIIEGRVLKVMKDHVIVDIGYKSEGRISIDEFRNTSGKLDVAEGQKINVLLERREDDEGKVVLSKEKADKLKVWDEISDACERNEIIEGTISQRVKGGLSVTVRGGVKAFLPGSQVDLRPIRNLEKMLGKTFKFKVIKFNKKRGNIVLSRRALLEQERNEMKARTLEKLEEGIIVTGIIKNITEYGAFVDLGGIDGLLHITDMSWGRIQHPSDMFKVGQEVEVRILKYNSETERVSLGLKQCHEDPWESALDRYPIGMRVSGRIVSLTDYGAFVELEEGVEGLIHVSEMSWTKRVKHPSKLLNIGDQVECVVLDVDLKTKRISLGLKQLEPEPWTLFTQKYQPGDKISGKIRSLTEYGVFVGIEDGVDGMVHKSDISWTKRINHPSEVFAKGDDVEAVILNINHGEKKVSLGIKQLEDDPWERIPKDYPLGEMLKVKITKVTDFGAFVELEKGIEGLIHVSEMSSDRVDDPRKIVEEGSEVMAEIITVDTTERKIGLSLKTISERESVEGVAKYMEEAREPARKTTLGDLIKQKLGDVAKDLPDAQKAEKTKEEPAQAEPEPEAEAESTDSAPAGVQDSTKSEDKEEQSGPEEEKDTE